MSSFAPDEEQKEFVYAGGEFENDAPYVPDEGSATGGGGVSDMDALLSDLIGSGSYDAAEDADTCFSMNAAASFAAISEPEEQVGELALQVLDAETLVNVVDVVTPVEVMQVTLLLEFLAEHTSASAAVANLPPALQAVPTLVVGRADAVSAWFTRSEKSLMQALSVLGLSLNKETVGEEAAAASAAAAAPLSSAAGPLVYTLLFRGTKVTSLSLIRSLLTDLFALLALPDVLDLDCLTKQLVKEMGTFVCDRRMANPAAATASSSSPAVHSHLASLRSRFLGVSSTTVLTGSAFTVDLAAAHSAAVVTLPAHDLATLRRMHHTRQDADQPGELYVRVWVDHWQQCWLAVNAAVDKELAASVGGAPAQAAPAVPIDAFLRSLTPQSALASLLSPESTDAEDPGAFFVAFLAATRQMQQMEARREELETPAAASSSATK